MNTYTTGPQQQPAVAVHGDGSFVVVWQSGIDYSGPVAHGDDGIGVFLQRFDAAATRVGSEQHVNTFTTATQAGPAVSALGGGAFVVTWASGCFYGESACGPDGTDSAVALQRFDSAGALEGGELVVNTFFPGWQSQPDVAASPAGDFVIVWSNGSYAEPPPDRDVVGISARRFEAGGIPAGDETPVNVFTAGFQVAPAVAMDGEGSFVAVWTSHGYGASVRARGFDATGTPFGEFEVSSDTQYAVGPAVAATGTGEFVVVWEVSQSHLFGGPEIRARRFAASGTPLGPEFTVNSYAPGAQTRPAVAADASGNFVVTWRSDDDYPDSTSDRDSHGVFGQAFSADGVPLGFEFQVNTSADGFKGAPAIGAGGHGRFVIAWTATPQSGTPSLDGDDAGVFARQASFRPCSGSGECDDDDPCTSDTCESALCLNPRLPGCCRTSAECDDRDPCTDDVCTAGACTHVPVTDCTLCSRFIPCVVSPKPCTTIACNELLHRCEFVPIEGCCVEPSDCDDGLACTVDGCDEDHACTSAPISDCVDCSTDADCKAGCLVEPETCVAGRCETPAVCPIVTLDDAEPTGKAGKLLIRIEVPAAVPGDGKVRAVVIGAIGMGDAGDAPSPHCRQGKVMARARTQLVPGGGSNLLLALTRDGKRCLAADPDGTLPVDVRVRVKRKKAALAEMVVPRVWRR